ncbi:Plasmodium exported protein (Pm-fam-a like), unknown function [Plasmodium malariae]|uniref:Fam-m protein n=1 Tax=Plasmodium malariae TaxID=5858 RepID=A0A1A8WIB5_PLAMA|nr:Plasmodium exported protein (Pm-fam-a like), unknown function [Plasmodium malariae]
MIHIMGLKINTLNIYTNEDLKLGKISNTKNDRLLAKYKQHTNSNNLELKDNITNNGEFKKTNITNNEKWDKRKNEQFNRSLLNKSQYYTEVIDDDNGIFDGKHFHFEKKWIKKKDYDHFFEKKRRIGDISLKKIKFGIYGFGVAIFFIFTSFGKGLPILHGKGLLKIAEEWLRDKGLLKILWNLINETLESNNLELYNLYLILYLLFFLILSVIVTFVIFKILRNNEKYQKIKLMKE